MPAQSTNLILALFTLLAIVSQTSQRSHPPVGYETEDFYVFTSFKPARLACRKRVLNLIVSNQNAMCQVREFLINYPFDGKGPTKQDCSQYAYLPSSKAFGCENQDSYTCNENPDGIAYIECPYTACHSE
ncbi:uncharacterized protein MELLADRAFT_59719 [Melampsora larici-populina 98AG31]|uniref:Secreted protein n=1 Tax=Melampsora larici-populina (strain 98AG31 / pathotype 3-4-7) TaxID=747676 RepID=F4R719_MELLP|nr:uncharacterized protein MELLADRAFT_59719 [Melampsora larici-populina 98AG31]EGG11500.1 secreted protein [Melampsora larici-populina 98AG31]